MKEILTLLLSCITCRGLGIDSSRDCALLSAHGHLTHYQVTDGKELLISTWDTRRELLSCSVEEDEEPVRAFLTKCTRQEDELYRSYGGFAEARVACHYYLQSRRTQPNDHHARVKRGFTYPGTLWCGAGNNADKDTDLGEHRETDSCCRTHDHCNHVIHPLTSNYGHWNLRWHTISHCQCDDRFKKCLRKVNDTASRVVGQAFFNVIKVQCFDLTYKQHCAKRTWYGWCEKYENTTVAVLKDSGLYDYGGNLIDESVVANELDPTNPPSAHPSAVDNDRDGKKKDKTKKKERKNKKGKGLKGKRKNKLKKENVESPAKEIWGKNTVKDDKTMPEKQPLDILDEEPKQDAFNDVLNDEPIRNNEAKPSTPMPTYKMEELKAKVTSTPPASRPCTRKPEKKSRQERKGRREGKKKPKTEPCGSSKTQ